MKARDLLRLPVGTHTIYYESFDKKLRIEYILEVRKIDRLSDRLNEVGYWIKEKTDSYGLNSVFLTFHKEKMRRDDYDKYYRGDKVEYDYLELSAMAGPTWFKVHSREIYSNLSSLHLAPRSSYKEWCRKIETISNSGT